MVDHLDPRVPARRAAVRVGAEVDHLPGVPAERLHLLPLQKGVSFPLMSHSSPSPSSIASGGAGPDGTAAVSLLPSQRVPSSNSPRISDLCIWRFCGSA